MLGALLTGSLTSASEPPEALLLTTHFPPYAMQTGADAPGPLAKLALAAIKRSGHAGSVDFVPWPRAQATAMREANALIIPLVRNSERESSYQWIGTLHCRSMGFVALRSRMQVFDESAVASSRIAVLRAAPHGAALKARSLQEATSFEDMAKMLQLSMVDALYGSHETILQALQARGVERSALALSAPVETDALWLAASPSMPKATAEALRQALKALHKDGTAARLLEQGGLSRSACAAAGQP